jgi:hypothetical protein
MLAMKVSQASASAPASRPASTSRPGPTCCGLRRDVYAINRAGVSVNTPTASPDHHNNADDGTAVIGTTPPRYRLVTPTAALTMVASKPDPTNASTSRTRSTVGRNPARRNSNAALVASAAFPTAISPATPNGTGVNALKAKAPISTPSASRGPNTTTAATANPLGSHTGAMLVYVKASANDIFAATR